MGKLKMAHELLVSALKGGTHLGSDHVGTAQYFFWSSRRNAGGSW